jgi:large subunit ribosomal protein L15
MRLNELRDNQGATRARKRLGRGIGSGLGKTSGRGMKGQKSRSGVAIKGFEGGQMPLSRRLPKRGFKNIFSKHYNEINVGRVQVAIDAGRLDAKNPVTLDALMGAGLIRRRRDGVRLLGYGEIKTKLAFEVTGASANAIKAVEAAGGSVTLTPLPRPKGKDGEDGKAEKQKPARAKSAGAKAQKTTKAKDDKAKKPQSAAEKDKA